MVKRRLAPFFVLCTVLSILLIIPAAAQTARTPGQVPADDPRARIIAMLASPDASVQAWGAWFAGRDRLDRVRPDLERVIRERIGDTSLAGRAAADMALDALIQMQAPLAATALADVFAHRPTQALVLASLAADDSADDFLAEVVSTGDGMPWFTAANLLLGRRKSFLAATILRDLRIKLRVWVVNSGGMGSGEGGGVGVGCGGIGLAPGFPPWAHYSLTVYARPGVVVLSDGPRPTYYIRTVSRAGETPSGSTSFILGPTPSERLKYLAAMLHTNEQDLPIKGYEQQSVVWESDSQVHAAIERFRADAAVRYSRLLALLVSERLLTEDKASEYPPQFDLDVQDHRATSGR